MFRPLPCDLPAPAIPQLVEHLLGAPLGEPQRTALEDTTSQPVLAWRRFHWRVRGSDVTLSLPLRAPNRSLVLRVAAGDGVIELEGPCDRLDIPTPRFVPSEGCLVNQRVSTSGLEGLLASFFTEAKLTRIPTLPRKWARMRRRLVSPIATHSWIAPDVDVRLGSDARDRLQWYVLSTSSVGLVFLGLLRLLWDPTRLRLALDRGRPLPRLREIFPIWEEIAPVEPLADETGEDRMFSSDEIRGLFQPARGSAGRQWSDLARWLDTLIREVRCAEGDSGALDPDDPTAAWSVEWCASGNLSYVPGHPGGSQALFGRSLPGNPRTYDVILHGATPTSLARWKERLAARGLRELTQ